MTLLDEKSAPVKSGGIASLLGASISIAEKTKDQGLYESIRGMYEIVNNFLFMPRETMKRERGNLC